MSAETVGASVETASPDAPAPARFRRVKRGRWWSYELGGKRCRSVTQLLAGIPKPNLIEWSAKEAAQYAYDNVDTISRMDRDGAIRAIAGAHNVRRNTAATKGSDIHRIAERLILGEHVEFDEAIAGYVDAYMAWLTDWQPQPVAVEGGIVNRRWRYAGTFDLLTVISAINTAPVVVDVKTGGSGVWPETCLQVSAYRHADGYLDADGHEQPMPQTAGGYALWLGDDGNYEFLPLECGDDLFAVFLHAGHIATFMDREKDELIGLPLAAPPQAVPA